MKRKTTLAYFLLTVILLSGCSPDNESLSNSFSFSNDSEYNVTYNYTVSDYPVYKNAEELITASDIVLTGKVTDIFFQMLDSTTGLPPTDQTEERNNELCTIYTVEVISTYKGDASEAVSIRTQGGLKDEYLDQQILALGERASNGITVAQDMPEIKIGETYLFSLRVFDGTDPCLMNPDQGIIKVSELSEAVVKDEYGYISAKDMISYFGEEKWSAFKSINYIETE